MQKDFEKILQDQKELERWEKLDQQTLSVKMKFYDYISNIMMSEEE